MKRSGWRSPEPRSRYSGLSLRASSLPAGGLGMPLSARKFSSPAKAIPSPFHQCWSRRESRTPVPEPIVAKMLEQVRLSISKRMLLSSLRLEVRRQRREQGEWMRAMAFCIHRGRARSRLDSPSVYFRPRRGRRERDRRPTGLRGTSTSSMPGAAQRQHVAVRSRMGGHHLARANLQPLCLPLPLPLPLISPIVTRPGSRIKQMTS